MARAYARTVEERLDRHSHLDPDSGCRVWTGLLNEHGYGKVWLGVGSTPRRALAHRKAWEIERGEIPADKVLDHACHNRACINVQHLRLADPAQNFAHRRGSAGASTGYRNVSAHKRGGYKVRVTKGGKVHGRWHKHLEDAVAEAAQLRKELFGEFAGRG